MPSGAARLYAARAAAFSASFFFANGAYMPFFPVWLESRGLDAREIGAVLALPLFMRVFIVSPTMWPIVAPWYSVRVPAGHSGVALARAAHMSSQLVMLNRVTPGGSFGRPA